MKRYLILLLIGLLQWSVFAQTDIKSDSTKTDSTKNLLAVPLEAAKYIPPSPTAAAFARYGDIPVNYHTGLVKNDIPVFNFISREVSLPISLSYHFSGNKVEDLASWVGLGMSLNAGGVITRSVQGAADEGQGSPYATGYYARSIAGSFFSQNGKQYCIPRPLNYPTSNCSPNFSQDFQNALDGQHDTEPDIFFFNIGGYSGKFVFDSLAQAHFMPEQDLHVEVIYNGNGSTGTFNQFILTIPDGTRYYFGGIHGDANFPSGNIAIEKTHTDATNPITSAWYLTKIESADTKSKIFLSYQSENYAYFDLMQESLDYQNGWQGGFTAPQNFVKYRFQGVRLTNIYSSDNNTQVNFIANNLRLDIGEYNSGEFNSFSEAKYLNEIQILNGGIGFKKFVLSHDYFNASAGNILNSFKPATLQNNPNFYQTDLKRLKLLSIQEKSWDGTELLPPYLFEYENTISFPRRLCYSRDHWGYYTGNEYNGALINNSLMHIENNDGINGVPTALVLGLGWRSNRSTNPAFAGVGVLKKITYPTGGYTVFELESNQMGSFSPTIFIGGLRVAAISNFNTNGQRLTKKAFDYLSSGILYAKPTYFYTAETLANPCGISSSCFPPSCPTSIVSSATLLPLNSTQGNHIGYREVKVFEIDNQQVSVNGFQLFTYNTSPPISETFYPGSTDDYGGVRFYNYPLNPLRPNYNQGTLAKEETINASNFLVHKVSYEYESSSKIIKIPSLKIDNHTVANIAGGNKYYNFYTFRTGKNNLTSKITTQCQQDGTACVLSTETFEYGSAKHYQMTRKSQAMSKGDSLIVNYKYSYDYGFNGATSFDAASQGIKTLQVKHQLVAIEEQSNYKNPNGGEQVLTSKLSQYDAVLLKPSTVFILKPSNTFLPIGSFNFSSISNVGGQAVFIKDSHYPSNADIQFSYNGFGNVAEIEQPQNSGNISSFLWSYGGAYPVAIVKNASYASLESVLSPSFVANLEQNNTYSDTQIIGAITPIFGIPNSLSAVFTHAPNRGLTSSVSAHELKSIFEYDKLGRLQFNKDHNGNILAENSYLYASLNQIINKQYRTASQSVLNGNYLDYQQSNAFFDGLGNPIQTIGKQLSPTAKDIILSSPIYNDFGKVYKNLLPCPVNSSSGGYVSNAISEAQGFYADNAPMDSIIFEASNLARIAQVYGPGQEWRTANKKQQQFYETAGTDTRYYKINTLGDIELIGTYPANSLFKNRSIDEQGNENIEIIDLQGRLIEKRQQLEAGNYAHTHFIYDGLGRPRAVIQPNGYELNSSIAKNSADWHNYVFSYEYDSRGRMHLKHVPSGGDEYFVYDKFDRLLLSQTAQQRQVLPNEPYQMWTFYKYDVFNREIMRGTFYDNGTLDGVEAYIEATVTTRGYESRNTTPPLYYSTGNSYPNWVNESNIRQINYYDDYTNWLPAGMGFDAGNAYHAQYANAKGLQTGSRTKKTENSAWLASVLYRDNKNRIIQSFEENAFEQIERTDLQYNFAGEPLQTKAIHKNASNAVIATEIQQNQYDHAGLLLNIKHGINATPIEIVRLSYDEIRRLATKKILPNGTYYTGGIKDYIIRPNIDGTVNQNNTQDIAKRAIILQPTTDLKAIVLNSYTAQINPNAPTGTAISGLQTINYAYHIRGGLFGINLDASKNAIPSTTEGDLFSYKLDYQTAGYWDGNIGKQTWATQNASTNALETRSYLYNYDASSRLKYATYAGIGSENFSIPNMSYDKNGNITNLQRNGLSGSSSQMIDNLSYNYTGNRLNYVNDAVSGNTDVGDFRNNNTGNDDYTYWNDGSLKSDKNKGISQIEYDSFLRKVKLVSFTNGNWIKFYYDGAGTLLKRLNSNGDYWDYVGNMIYKNGVPYQISIPEGRAVWNGSTWDYEFEYRDHLGNMRLGFKAEGNQLVKTQVNTPDPLGLDIKSFNSVGIKSQNFQFNKIEKIDDFGINIHHAFFRDGDSQIGRWWQIDPKPDVSMSLYSMMGNNAVRFMDMLGDTIKFTDDFKNNKAVMGAYNTFLNSKGGNNFKKNYSEGGKYGSVTVTFGLKHFYAGTSAGTTSSQINSSGESTKILNKEDAQNAGIKNSLDFLQKGSSLNFNISLDDKLGLKKLKTVEDLEFFKIIKGASLLHESQHVFLMTESLLKGGRVGSESEQHSTMKDISTTFYQDRIEYLSKYPTYFQKRYDTDYRGTGLVAPIWRPEDSVNSGLN